MNVSEIITNEIIKIIESGTIPWDKPFVGVPPRNIRGTGYRGINLLILGTQGHESPYWLTFNQCRGLGGKIVKGSKGTKIIFWKWIAKNPDFDPDNIEPEGKGTEGKYPILRYYTVFNLSQTEGIDPEKIPVIPEMNRPEGFDPIQDIDQFIADIPGLEIRYSHEDCGFYNPTEDYIQIPESKYFKSPQGYYSVHFHEIAHWTGSKSRLNRDLRSVLDPESYSFEELVAELTSAFLCGYFGIEKSVIRNSAAYISNWVRVLKSDPKMIIKASSQAQKSLDYLLKISGRTESEKSEGDPVQVPQVA